MRTLRTLFLATAAAGLAACGEKTPEATPPRDVTPRTGTASPRTDAPRAQQPVEAALPAAAPLSQDAASRVLADAIESDASPEVIREALLGVAESAGSATVRTVAAKLLAKGGGTGGYDDPEGAAAAIEALARSGDPKAPELAVALAKAAIADGDVYGEYVTMLSAVQGNAEARSLLVQIADDPLFYGEAIRELASLRERGAAARFHDVATDADEETYVRATAAAGLLAIGDPRAEAALDALVRGTDQDLTTFDVIDGLAVPGVHEALPWIRKIADPIIAEGDNCALEIASAAAACATIRGPGGGVKEEMDWLRSLLGKDDGHSDEDVQAALWTLGDDAQSQGAASILTSAVTGVAVAVDESAGVDLLHAIGRRGAARNRVFGRIVDAAAAVPLPNDPRRPDAAARAWRIRVAAARAWLASK